ncbi:MAG: AAA family ATPase [Rectinemataceae bacterium]
MAIDADRDAYGRFILTGSNQFSLNRRISESLAGRVGLLSLLPFERFEMPAKARKLQMLRGSYPDRSLLSSERRVRAVSSRIGERTSETGRPRARTFSTSRS